MIGTFLGQVPAHVRRIREAGLGRRAEIGLSLALALLTLASRWPYRARMLYNWDAVQFALALREFDVAKHQPHPPGYVLYVGLGRLIHAGLGDASLVYVVLAMCFSAGTTFLVYWLARALYGRLTAFASAALLAVSPLFWFYGAIGLTYAGEAFAATLVALHSLRTLRGSVVDLYRGALLLGLAGGMRLSVLVLLFPLWLGSGILGMRSRPPILRALGVLGAAILAWLLPLLWFTGGPGAYLSASTQLYSSVVLPSSVLGAALDTTFRQIRYVLESVVVGLGPLILVLFALPSYIRQGGWRREEWFLLGWIIPPATFYGLVHFGQAGYVLTFLPALVVLLAHVLVETVTNGAAWLRRPHWRWALTATALGILVLVNTGFFVSARPVPRDFTNRHGQAWLWRARDEMHDWIMSRTVAALREHEAVLRTYVDTIRAVYDPADTALLTELGNPRSYPWLRHAMFYLSEFPVYQLSLGPAPPGFYAPQSSATMVLTSGTVITVPDRVRHLVWFVDHWDPSLPRPAGLQEIQLAYGRYLYVLPLGRFPVTHAGYMFVRPAR